MGESLSKIPVRIKLEKIGEAEGEFVRIYAPLTVDRLLRMLPIEGRVHPLTGGFSLIVGIKRGEEKSVRKVEAGTIAYWPMGDALCLFYGDAAPYSPVNRAGRITKGLELVRNLSSGSRIRIERLTSG